MKKIFILCIMLSVAVIITSCKKQEGVGSVNLAETDAPKAAALLKEATDMFNAGNAETAAQKAQVAKRVLETIMGQKREVEITSECPISYIRGDENMIQLAVACKGFQLTQPQNVDGAFDVNTVQFYATMKNVDSKNQDVVTAQGIADTVKNSPVGTKFTGRLQITDNAGILMAAEKGFLSSYSVGFNVKILEIQKAD